MKYFEEHEDLDSLLRRFNKKIVSQRTHGFEGWLFTLFYLVSSVFTTDTRRPATKGPRA